MNRYHVTKYSVSPEGRRTTALVQAIEAPDAYLAITYAYPGLTPTAAPDEDIAEWNPGPTPDGFAIIIEAEPAPPTQYGALREAIARALVAETLAEAAVAELARVAGLPTDTAHTCLLSLLEWIPGDPITDEQCRAFLETPQEAQR